MAAEYEAPRSCEVLSHAFVGLSIRPLITGVLDGQGARWALGPAAEVEPCGGWVFRWFSDCVGGGHGGGL